MSTPHSPAHPIIIDFKVEFHLHLTKLKQYKNLLEYIRLERELEIEIKIKKKVQHGQRDATILNSKNDS